MTTTTLLRRLSAAACIIALGVAFSACEEVLDAEGLPYVERLVVDAILAPGIPADSIYIRRTLPLSGAYDKSKAILTDITGYVESEGRQYPLVHIDSSRYRATGLVPESGKRYKLVAQWRGKNIQAETTVPYTPELDTAILRLGNKQSQGYDDRYYDTLTVVVRPRGSEVYAVEARVEYDRGLGGYQSLNLTYDEVIARATDLEPDGKVHLNYRAYHIFDVNAGFVDKNLIILYAFDEPFYDYYFSITNDDNDAGPFASGNRPIYWNVQGDGIGIFMGRAITVREL